MWLPEEAKILIYFIRLFFFFFGPGCPASLTRADNTHAHTHIQSHMETNTFTYKHACTHTVFTKGFLNPKEMLGNLAG